MKQVDKSHYDFSRYMHKARWNSIWHQIDELASIKPNKTLEIGPGSGTLKAVAKQFELNIETLDIDPELCPDHVGSATAIPLPDDSFDAVCAFQMLEHLHYDESLLAFKEMCRVSRLHILISLPDAKPAWAFKLYIPKLGSRQFLLNRPSFGGAPKHTFDGEHYWEINKESYSIGRLISDLSKNATLQKTYRVFENPYHRFFVFKKHI